MVFLVYKQDRLICVDCTGGWTGCLDARFVSSLHDWFAIHSVAACACYCSCHTSCNCSGVHSTLSSCLCYWSLSIMFVTISKLRQHRAEPVCTCVVIRLHLFCDQLSLACDNLTRSDMFVLYELWTTVADCLAHSATSHSAPTTLC